MYYNAIFYIDYNVIQLLSLEIILNSIMQIKLIFNKNV